MSAVAPEALARPVVKLTGGPRTGKSAALIQCVIALLDEGVPGERILLAAPTALACDELAGRLARALGPARAAEAATVAIRRPVDVCAAVVEEARAAGATDRFGRVLTPEEYRFLVEDLKTLGQKNQRLSAMLSFFFAQWSNLEPEGDWVIAGEESSVIALMRSLLAHYRAGLRDEVPYLAATLLREGATSAPYDYVLCDDFQNLSHAEQDALSRCCTAQLVVAGDETRAVKGASLYPHPEGFAAFERVRTGVAVVDLGPGEPARGTLLQWARPEQELGRLPELVSALASQGDGSASVPVIVAVPTRFWGRQAARALRRAGIPVDTAGLSGGLPGDPRTAGQEGELTAYAALLLAADGNDPLAWRLWGGLGHALTHSDLWRAVRQRAQADGTDLVAALAVLAEEAQHDPRDPIARDLITLWKSGQAHLARVRGLRGSALVDALGIAEGGALARAIGPIAEDDDARALRDRVRAFLTSPRRTAGVGAVPVVLYEAMAGLGAETAVLPGLVNGLIPARDVFDIVKDPARRDALRAEEAVRLRCALAAAPRWVGSTFAKSDIEVAERGRFKVERIASEGGERTALLSQSDLLADNLGSPCDRMSGDVALTALAAPQPEEAAR